MLKIPTLIQKSDHPLKIAVTGDKHVGKTTALKQIYQSCIEHNMDVSGFVENALFQDGQRIGYEFMDINRTDERRVVASRIEPRGYQFHEDAWIWAEKKILESESHNILIVDELGRLEATGDGMMPYLIKSLQTHPRHLIASVRYDVFQDIQKQIGEFDDIFQI